MKEGCKKNNIIALKNCEQKIKELLSSQNKENLLMYCLWAQGKTLRKIEGQKECAIQCFKNTLALSIKLHDLSKYYSTQMHLASLFNDSNEHRYIAKICCQEAIRVAPKHNRSDYHMAKEIYRMASILVREGKAADGELAKHMILEDACCHFTSNTTIQ